MVQPSGKERTFYKDDAGTYYVQTAETKEPVAVPADQNSEVEAVISGQDDTAGFIALASLGVTPQLATYNLGGRQLSALGRCGGDCGRSFGVLDRGQFQR